jgi:hypothetical protein
MDDLTQTREYVNKNYSRRYRVTLAFTPYNVEKALEVYRFGVENALGIVQTVIRYYGYRYRRMENFLKECKLWKEREGWLHWKVLTKLYFEYTGKKESITVEVFVYHLAPEWLIGEHDEEACETLFWHIISELKYEWLLTYLSDYGVFRIGDAKPREQHTKYGLDAKLHEVGYMAECSQSARGILVIWRRGKIAETQEFMIHNLANYAIYGELVC